MIQDITNYRAWAYLHAVITKHDQITGDKDSITTWAAIVAKLNYGVVALEHLSSIHFTVASIGISNKHYIIISAYFQFRITTARFTMELANILEKLD